MPQSRRSKRDCESPPRVRDARPQREKPTKREMERPKDAHDLREIQLHYEALDRCKMGVLTHVASQHSILDVLYGGDTGRPMPSWTYQTTPEVGVSDQQHTGRCWIFATLAVLGHVFRSQYGIANARATFSEGYLGFWDLYEKSRLFLQVAYDTRCLPLDNPSMSDLLKSGISDGGDYIFCLNLLDRYGIVPTEYYPNSSYGSMSTEALVTLLNQVLRDNAITLRTTGDKSQITPMLSNVFAILCMGLGTPPAPWKKLDWQIDQYETMAQFATELTPPQVAAAVLPAQRQAVANIQSAALPPQQAVWRPSVPPVVSPAPQPVLAPVSPPPQPVTVPPSPPVAAVVPQAPAPTVPLDTDAAGATYPITVPPKAEVVSSATDSGSIAELVAALSGPTQPRTLQPEAAVPLIPPEVLAPPSPADSTVTAAGLPDEEYGMASDSDRIPSSTRVITDENAMLSGEPQLVGSRPPRRTEDIPTRDSSRQCMDISSAGDCRKVGGFARIMQRIAPGGCKAEPLEGSGSFFRETMPDSGCLLGRLPAQACRLAYTISERPASPKKHKSARSEKPRVEEAMIFDYTPRDFYYRFLNSVRFVPVVCDPRFPPGTRIISNDANMYGGLPSLYLNISIDDIEAYTVASLKRNIPVWFACDVKKQLTPEGGRMCSHTDRLAELLPEPHAHGTKLQEIRHFNAIANHALLISAVSIKAGKPVAWRIVNSWGDVGRNSGVFVACGEWFREHVYSINAVYDTMHTDHKEDLDLRQSRPTVRLGPFDPSVI